MTPGLGHLERANSYSLFSFLLEAREEDTGNATGARNSQTYLGGFEGPGLGKVLSGHVSRTTVSLFPPIPAPLILSLLAVARKSGQELGYLLLEAERKREKGVKVTEF